MAGEKRRRRKPPRGYGGGRATQAKYGAEHYRRMNELSRAARAARGERAAAEKPVNAHLLLAQGFLDRVTAVARELAISRTALIRLALEDYLAACEAAEPLAKKRPDP